MATGTELKAEQFFASRSGVCVYVTVQSRVFRIHFTSFNERGVVETQGAGAEDARAIAQAAFQQHAAALAPLFEKVARNAT
jgi:hypothetical protein